MNYFVVRSLERIVERWGNIKVIRVLRVVRGSKMILSLTTWEVLCSNSSYKIVNLTSKTYCFPDFFHEMDQEFLLAGCGYAWNSNFGYSHCENFGQHFPGRELPSKHHKRYLQPKLSSSWSSEQLHSWVRQSNYWHHLRTCSRSYLRCCSKIEFSEKFSEI